jgi:pilus assembly protein CpaF
MFGRRSGAEADQRQPNKRGLVTEELADEHASAGFEDLDAPSETQAVPESLDALRENVNGAKSNGAKVNGTKVNGAKANGVPHGADTGRSKSPEAQKLVADAAEKMVAVIDNEIADSEVPELSRGDLAKRIDEIVGDIISGEVTPIADDIRRDIVTHLINHKLSSAKTRKPGSSSADGSKPLGVVDQAKQQIQPLLLDRIDISKANEMPRGELAQQVGEIVAEIVSEERLKLNLLEQRDLVTVLLNDMLGLGPLEPLLDDESVNDIMVNGPKQVYVERAGKLELTDVTFRDNAHVMNIATRIVSAIGRRVDESTPLVDARLADGSRVNIIIPPLAIDGPSISIRKFSQKKITLDVMARQENISAAMAKVLKIAARSRLNILISGGTGSGKTTLLNALSQLIDHGERVVTIEDAAELQLQQPHVVRLETRTPNLEGDGEVTQTDLVKNALRMRPDRIILGEIRGAEALDMLQAMNTGHDGSLGTIHANSPREALTRLENMVAMSGVKLPAEAVRAQIAGAVNMIVQVSRMRDGVRRITHVTEIIGMEGEVITTQDLFTYHFEGEKADGRLKGEFKPSALRPAFVDRAAYFGLEKALLEAVLG